MPTNEPNKPAVAQSRSMDGLGDGLDFVTALFANLSASQERLTPDMEKVLYENLGDLYEA